MKDIIKTVINFLAVPVKRRLLFIGILCLIAIINFFSLGLARRTFIFYTIDGGIIAVEDRMLKHSRTRENDIIRYTEETLLGPVSPDLLPLFPRETKLKSLMYRDKVVYIDFSESAALIPLETGKGGPGILDNFSTLYDGIIRNFSYINDVRFFIEGNAVFLDQSRQTGESHSGRVGEEDLSET